MSRLVDSSEREQIRTELDRNMLVEAAAGTGKTTALVERMIAVLAEGRARVQSIVAVTFTEKAAGELKLRIRTELERARQSSQQPQRGRLEDALAHLEEARVGTIHGFCADLLRERSVEAGVDPQFAVLTEAEAPRLYAEAFQSWFQRKLEDPPEGLRRSLRRASRSGPVERLKTAGWTLAEWRDFPAPWLREAFDRDAGVDALVERLMAFAELSGRCDKPAQDNLCRDTTGARRLAQTIRRAELVRGRDYDGVEGQLIHLAMEDRNFRRPRKGRTKMYGEGLTRAEVQEAHESLKQELEAFRRDADADLAACIHHELAEVTRAYQTLKERSGKLDFVDLLLLARDLVRDSETVRADYQRLLSHVFIDEFQDTDPLQAELLLLLSGQDPSVVDWREVDPTPGKLFLVADPKQSIYRFRRADVGTYFDVKALLEKRDTLLLELRSSFRSVPEIQHAVNAAFADVMDGDRHTLQAEYVPLAPVREGVESQPSLVALPVPEPYRYRLSQAAIEASLPAAVGGFVEWLLKHSGWTVTERQNPEKRVPISPRHVCILFRRLQGFFSGDVTRGYVDALEARGIRHLLVGGKSFHEREEVETMRTALTAIEWPDDELSVFATLRGALFSVGDEELLEYRNRYGRLHPFRQPGEGLPDHLHGITESLDALARLHRSRNRRPVADTIHRLLEQTRAHAGFAMRPSGEQALANVLHVAEQARSYEGSGGISFRGFVERLTEEAARGQAAEAPILEEGSEGVRIMTVHKAKGLEFPVVVLADITCAMRRSEAGRTIDPARKLCAMKIGGWSPRDLRLREEQELGRDAAEGVRLAYVAATRARDLLVVPAVADQAYERGWIAPLNRAIYPAEDRWSDPGQAAGVPEFGTRSVLNHPDANFRDWVKPGAYDLAGDHRVVWWDPERLNLEAQPNFGIRQEELVSKDVAQALIDGDTRRYERWSAARDSAIIDGAVARFEVTTATRRAAAEETEPTDVELVELPVEAGRPAGVRFGALVHAVLAVVALDADEAQVRAMAELQGRIFGAPAAEIEAAVPAVTAALGHPLMGRARQADQQGTCRRETPVTLREGESGLVDGVVDLAFRENGRWIVIDFKTDRELADHLPTYRRQVELYARAIREATGDPALPVLFRV